MKRVLLYFFSMVAVMGIMTTGCGKEEKRVENVEKADIIRDLEDFSADKVSLSEAYLTNALSLEVEYLLSFDMDRWLAGFRETAGLDMKGKDRYPGWEDSLIAGHSFGHYISACSFAYLSPDISKEDKETLLANIKYIVDELKICQDNTKGKPGFIWCATVINSKKPEIQFDNVEVGKTNITTEAWVPWYTMHKILQGLIDVYVNTGYEPAKQVAEALGDWVYNRVSDWSLSVRSRTLATEYGGMNDCLYDLYHITGEEKYAVAAHQFDEETLFEKVLSGKKNALNNLHANTTIPKFVGAMKRFIYLDGQTINGEKVDASKYLEYCEAFFAMVRDNHTYITGGNSEWEHFGGDAVLDAERTNCNNETCNTYNMLKLSKLLFMKTADKQYADFYENTYINAILSSQNPETGMTMYFQPMATGYFKVYSTPFTKFWCCTGTGMENFTRLADAIYFAKDNSIFVNMYLSSSVAAAGLTLKQESEVLNGGNAVFTITDTAGKTAKTILRFRIPDWCDGNMEITLNGDAYAYEVVEGYACVAQNFKKGDVIKLNIPMKLVAYSLPDSDSVLGFKYGPIVLSAGLGSENMKVTTTGVIVTIPQDKKVDSETVILPKGVTRDSFINNLSEYFTKDGMNFALKGTELVFTPHYTKYKERYGIYFYFVTEEEAQEETESKKQSIDTVIDTVQPGYGQYENDALHDMKDNGSVGVTNDGTYRYASENGSFTYIFSVEKGKENFLSMTLRRADNGKTLKITAGTQVIFEDKLDYIGKEDSYSLKVSIPASIINSAEKKNANGNSYDVISVTFSGSDGKESAKVCDFIYVMTSEKKYEVDGDVAYFVDCGDHNVYTVAPGERFGVYNSVTEQLYGYDAVTGKKWGLKDNPNDRYGGSAKSEAIYTANTWAYEFNIMDGLAKEDTCRYTKNQYENGIKERYLDYYFELPNGEYEVEIGFSNPWACSNNHMVYADKGLETEKVLASDYQVTGKPLTAKVTVTNGALTLNFRNSTQAGLAINVTYIKIKFVKQ